MYIYLDESYNLKDRDKKQFISINGFMVLDERPLFKEWKKIRKPYAKSRRRIHAADNFFDGLRIKAMEIINKKADFISNIFYRAYVKNDSEFLNEYKYKIVQLKNPLKKADFSQIPVGTVPAS